jgi:hypothetical protein
MRDPQEKGKTNESEDKYPIPHERGDVLIRGESHHILYELHNFGESIRENPLNQRNAQQD